MIQFEKEIIDFLGLPSIPKKEHDGKSAFEKGVAIIELRYGREAYAVCKFDTESGDKEPRIVKTFGIEPFIGIKQVFVVPNYMNDIEDVKDMDLDDESKKRAEQILQEAKEIENEGVDNEELKTPKNEYYFDHITNDEQGMAFIRSYNSRNKIKGKIPSTHEGIIMRLAVIFSDTMKKSR